MRFSTIGALALVCASGTVLADNQKPTVPANVVATALSSSSVRITWNEPFDNVGVDGYNIYRNRSYYATVHNTTNFIDTRVNEGQTYNYSVVAFDRARNYTVLSQEDAATPGRSSDGAAPQPRASVENGGAGSPAVPSGLRAEVRGSDQIALFWSDAGSNVAGYNVYRDGSYRATVRSTSWADTGLSSDREYRYDLVAFSNDAQFSAHSDSVMARTSGGSSSNASVQAAATSNVAPSSSVPSGYSLVFNDEFNGRSLDSSKWNSSYRWGPNWTINNEQQYYVDTINNPDFGRSPFSFDGNNMTISAERTPENLKSSANWKSYTSGALTTYNKFKMRYGYVEMRAKMPRGQGLWPAFWLLNQYDNGARPEIDVMEFLGRDVDTIYNVYHHYSGNRLISSPSYSANGPDYTADFHTFGMQWEPGKITWYVDGNKVNEHTSGVSNEEMYLIVNLALGGWWGGNVDGSTPFPARYVIDYIRAYKR